MAKSYRPYRPDEEFLLPPSLREWLPEDHLTYFVSYVVDSLEPMFSVFTDTPDFTPYSAQPISVPFDEMNPPLAATAGLQRKLAEASIKMDFSEPDAADPKVLNRAIWHSVRGYSTPYGARTVR